VEEVRFVSRLCLRVEICAREALITGYLAKLLPNNDYKTELLLLLRIAKICSTTEDWRKSKENKLDLIFRLLERDSWHAIKSHADTVSAKCDF
jgi:hypothetical protein